MTTPQSPTGQALFSTSLLFLQAAEKSQGNLGAVRWMEGPSSLPDNAEEDDGKTKLPTVYYPFHKSLK